jgi:hypothetical protein
MLEALGFEFRDYTRRDWVMLGAAAFPAVAAGAVLGLWAVYAVWWWLPWTLYGAP